MALILPFEKKPVPNPSVYLHYQLHPHKQTLIFNIYHQPLTDKGIIEFWSEKSRSWYIINKKIYTEKFLDSLKQDKQYIEINNWILFLEYSLPFISLKHHTIYKIHNRTNLEQTLQEIYTDLRNPSTNHPFIDKNTYSFIINLISEYFHNIGVKE